MYSTHMYNSFMFAIELRTTFWTLVSLDVEVTTIEMIGQSFSNREFL